jgi:hypothetical protein
MPRVGYESSRVQIRVGLNQSNMGHTVTSISPLDTLGSMSLRWFDSKLWESDGWRPAKPTADAVSWHWPFLAPQRDPFEPLGICDDDIWWCTQMNMSEIRRCRILRGSWDGSSQHQVENVETKPLEPPVSLFWYDWIYCTAFCSLYSYSYQVHGISMSNVFPIRIY